MQTLIYVVHTLPESGGFCKTELSYLSRYFKRIVVISNGSKNEHLQKLPDGVTLIQHPYLLSRLEKIYSSVQLFDSLFWQELYWLKVNKKLKLRLSALNTLLQAIYTSKKLKRNIEELFPIEIARNEITTYSFWMNNMAIGLAQLKKSHPQLVNICRAHGGDLYFERHSVGFLPCRRFIDKYTDHVIFISKTGKSYFERLVSKSSNNWKVAYLGSLPPSGNVNLTEGNETPVILTCSLVSAVKRLELLVEGLKHISIPLKWIHIGNGIDFEQLKKKAEGLPTHIEVDFKDYMPQENVVAFMQDLRPTLLVNVSSSEGLPVSMMEAMSIGIPVIGTNVGGVHEIVEHGSTGFLMSANPSPDEIASTISSYLSLEVIERLEFRKRARLKWESSFNGDKNYDAFAKQLFDWSNQKMNES
jgi:glycosyltransferase involved in cell wall biosynthesis